MATAEALRITPVPCPICERPVRAEQVGPWPRSQGPAPWHCGCYGLLPNEHYIGVNGDTEAEAIRNYNAEASKIRHGDFESPAAEFPPR